MKFLSYGCFKWIRFIANYVLFPFIAVVLLVPTLYLIWWEFSGGWKVPNTWIVLVVIFMLLFAIANIFKNLIRSFLSMKQTGIKPE